MPAGQGFGAHPLIGGLMLVRRQEIESGIDALQPHFFLFANS